MSLITFDIWLVLGILVIVGLIFLYKKAFAWGGLLAGAFVGCIISIIGYNKGNVFEFSPIKKAAIIGALIGLIISFVIRLKNKEKTKLQHHH